MYVNTKEMLREARAKHYMVIGAECWSLNSAQTLIMTAEKMKKPLIVMLWEGAPEPMASPELICDYVRYAAGKTDVPIAMHLDHAHHVETVVRAIRAGFSSVMLDASAMPFDENVTMTKEIVRLAHACGVTVEAELGHVGGRSGELETWEDSWLTVPEEASEFVRKTEVDSLAVSVGTVHGIYKGEPHIDMKRLQEIAAKVDIPLVLHGGSGTGTEILRECAKYGISKLNVMTDLMQAAQNMTAVKSALPDLECCKGIAACLENYMAVLS